MSKSITKKQRKNIGWLLLLWPWIALILSLIISAVISEVLFSTITTHQDIPTQPVTAVGLAANILVGTLGTVGVIGIFLSTPFGVYLLSTDPKKK